MTKRIRFDFGNLMASSIDDGVDPSLLEGPLADGFKEAYASVVARHAQGDLGFLDLPYAGETVSRVTELAEGFAQWFEDVVVLGIGGSGLGATALKEALLGPFWNAMTDEERDHFPRLHVVDNPDPHTFRMLLDRLEPGRTLFNVVSKSGATAETMSQYLVARAWIEGAVDDDKARGHFLFTTDPADGVLRQIGDAEGMPMLPVPPNVGGRFSGAVSGRSFSCSCMWRGTGRNFWPVPLTWSSVARLMSSLRTPRGYSRRSCTMPIRAVVGRSMF